MVRLKCVRCGHIWSTRLKDIPKRCPKCLTWLSPEMVRKLEEKVLVCVCGHRWVPKRDKMPKRCPKCVRELNEKTVRVEIIKS